MKGIKIIHYIQLSFLSRVMHEVATLMYVWRIMCECLNWVCRHGVESGRRKLNLVSRKAGHINRVYVFRCPDVTRSHTSDIIASLVLLSHKYL